jgi:integrase
MTARQVLNAKAGQKVGLGNGLRLVCDKRNDGRYFELRKRVRGKDYSWGVGNVETLTIAGCNKALSSARQQANKILEALASGADPAGIGKSAKSGEVLTGRSPVRDVAKQFVASKGQEWSSEAYRNRWLNSLEIHCKWLMDSPIADVTLDNVIAAIKPHWAVRTDTAERMARKLSRIFTYAEVLKLRTGDPADQKYLSHVLPQKGKVAPVKHREAMDYRDCPALFSKLSESDTASAKALQWVMLSACRSAEGRKMTWDEIDLGTRVWTMEAGRTKQRREFSAPITSEMAKIIEWASPIRCSQFVITLTGTPLSDVAIAKTLKRHTFQSNTVHGLRTSFRTWCQDTGVEEVVAEYCLNHVVGSKVRRAYARSDMLEERMRVMTDWADFLTSSS